MTKFSKFPENSTVTIDSLINAHNNHEITILGFRTTCTGALQKLYPANNIEYKLANHVYPESPKEYIADSTLSQVNMDNIPYAIPANQILIPKSKEGKYSNKVYKGFSITDIKSKRTYHNVEIVVAPYNINIRKSPLASLPIGRIHTLLGQNSEGCENTRLQFIRTEDQKIAIALSYTVKTDLGVRIVHNEAEYINSLDELRLRQLAKNIFVLGFFLKGETKLTNVAVLIEQGV